MFQSNLRCPDPPGIEPAVFFLKTSNLSSLAPKKSKKSILRKGLVARFSQDVQFELFGGQKVQKERLEKRFGGSIFSRRPIWAFWPPKSPKRASWEKVWWLDSWRVLEKILLPIGNKPISPYIYSFSGLQQKVLMTLFLQVLMSKFLSGRIQFCYFIFSRRPILAFWPPKNSNWTSWENKRTKLWLLRRGWLESRSGHSRLDCTFFGEFCV